MTPEIDLCQRSAVTQDLDDFLRPTADVVETRWREELAGRTGWQVGQELSPKCGLVVIRGELKKAESRVVKALDGVWALHADTGIWYRYLAAKQKKSALGFGRARRRTNTSYRVLVPDK
ncbi:hypothetical protein ACMD2_19778 [Ananas comosus]|uniref:Uncharacterized protein n=1 Tax=Ananas comosus TaxID=4615 RepID=A0A199V825_ANACO|nr:hypothetical protein ACMD2_19778 [Ananas comosus]